MPCTHITRSANVARIAVQDTSGTVTREGEIVEVLGRPGHEHYRVRWTDGRESIHFPAEGTRIFPKPSKRRRT